MNGTPTGTLAVWLLLAAAGAASASPAGAPATAMLGGRRAVHAASWTERMFEAALRKGLAADGMMLLVSVEQQRMLVADGRGVHARYRISTSRFGTGSRQGSHKTPLGLHRVADRIGDDEPAGRVFVARQPTPRVVPEHDWRRPRSRDMILTRILRLKGLTPGLNRGAGIDSYDRFIYIHGTNQEHLLGRPASHGCIRMGNRAMIALYRMLHGREAWCCIMERFPG